MVKEHTLKNSIGIDAIFQYAGSTIQIFSGTIFYIIIVRMFSLPLVGVIALFTALIGLFNIIFSFGLVTAAQHFTSYGIGKGEWQSVTSNFYKIIRFGTFFSTMGLVTVFILSPFIAKVFLHTVVYSGLVKILGIVLFGNIVYGILNATLLGLQKFRLSAIINIFTWIAYYFGSIILSFITHSLTYLIMGWIIGIFLGIFIDTVFIIIYIGIHKSSNKFLSSQELITYSFPLVISSLIGYGAVYVDRFIVAGLLSLSSLAIYNFSLLIASSLGFIIIPFNNMLMPKFSEMFGRDDRKSIRINVRLSSLMLSAIYVPAALGISALSPLLIKFFGSGIYETGAFPLSIIMFFSATFVPQYVLYQAVASVRRTRIFIYMGLFSFIANLFLSYTLIPSFGIVGAALGFSSVSVMVFTVLLYFALLCKRSPIFFLISRFSRVISAMTSLSLEISSF